MSTTSTAPTLEELKSELYLCCRKALAALNEIRTLPRARDVQQYWNNRARACKELLPAEIYADIEEEVGWDTCGPSGRRMPAN